MGMGSHRENYKSSDSRAIRYENSFIENRLDSVIKSESIDLLDAYITDNYAGQMLEVEGKKVKAEDPRNN